MAEARLEKRARGSVERLAGRAQHVVDHGRHCGWFGGIGSTTL
jgi:hypothetical protein